MSPNDFTLANPNILAFFEGSDDYIPVGEVIYLHEHPLITPNFVQELDAMLLSVADKLAKISGTEKYTKTLEKIAITLGINLADGVINREQATNILMALREAYELKKLIEKLG